MSVLLHVRFLLLSAGGCSRGSRLDILSPTTFTRTDGTRWVVIQAASSSCEKTGISSVRCWLLARSLVVRWESFLATKAEEMNHPSQELVLAGALSAGSMRVGAQATNREARLQDEGCRREEAHIMKTFPRLEVQGGEELRSKETHFRRSVCPFGIHPVLWSPGTPVIERDHIGWVTDFALGFDGAYSRREPG